MIENNKIANLMKSSASEAVCHALEKFEIILDYSHSSVNKVEEILSYVHTSIPRGLMRLIKKIPTDDMIWNLSEMYGGYIGETFRKHFGGEWEIRDNVPGASSPIITFSNSEGDTFFPVSKVWRRINNGEEDNVWIYYKFLQQRADKNLHDQKNEDNRKDVNSRDWQ